MGTVLWELQSGVERTLEAANLYFQTPERRTTKHKLQGRRFQSFRRKRSLTIIARGPGRSHCTEHSEPHVCSGCNSSSRGCVNKCLSGVTLRGFHLEE